MADSFERLRRQMDEWSEVARQGQMPDDRRMDTSNFATKADLAELRGDMREGFAMIRGDFEKLRADIAGSATTVAKERGEFTKWLLGIVLTLVSVIVVGFGGLYFQMSNTLRPLAQQAAAAPPQPPASTPR